MKEEFSSRDESKRNTTVGPKKVDNQRGKVSLGYYRA
jgi:hypothetical protein